MKYMIPKSIICLLLIFIANNSRAQLSGYIHDNYSLPIENAKIIFINEQDATEKYNAVSDGGGFYNITLLSNETLKPKTALFQASPNPFYYQTSISFSLENESRVKLSIINMNGQLIKVLENTNLPTGSYVYIWDGTSQSGSRQKPGMYIISLETQGKIFTQKVILIPGNEVAAVGALHELKSLTTATYKVEITAENADTLILRNILIPESKQLDFNLYRKAPVPFATVSDYLGAWNGTGYDQIFIKGINLGVSVPGTQPGELAATRDQYTRWLTMIGDAGFNAIRTYTLHYPRFYQELALYNNDHPDHPIYLFQGIWLQEDTLNGNLYHYTEDFDKGIREVIDCVHGRKTIGERFGKAFGKFDTDISRWVIGYIIGREIYPYEVEITDFLNVEKSKYEGTALKLPSGSPTEVWLAERLDNLITYEKTMFKVQRPVSASSWPTLDPISHPSEPANLTDEDKFSIDLQQMDMWNAPGGYFASFHAYPYYPDFVNRDPLYANVTDEEGPNAYLGYLRQLKSHYSGRPLLIAEYGVPSSWGNAHSANSGMNHGGLNEVQQGEMDIRLLKTIQAAGCGGGMLFAWIDEWFKRTWLLDPIKSETERMPLWHSIASAEENFGLIAFDLADPAYQQYTINGANTKVALCHAAADAEFFQLKFHLNTPLQSSDSLWIGLDTYKAILGESILPDKSVTNKRAEFSLLVKTDSVKLYVTKDYDPFGMWFIRNNAFPEQLFHSTVTNGAQWNLLKLKYNFEDTSLTKIGLLKVRKEGAVATSLDAVWFNGNEIYVRIPWHYLNFTDPSALLVLDDNRNTRLRETSVTDGIALTISYKKEVATTSRFLWNGWDQAPVTTERIKSGLSIITIGNAAISDTPIIPSKKSGKKKR